MYGFVLLAFFLTGCAVSLKKNPPVYFKLDAEVTLGGRLYPIRFTWRKFDRIVWDEGMGVHPDWAMTAYSALKIIDENYAIAIRLPSGEKERPMYFAPNLVLIDRRDLSMIREYEHVRVGAATDGFLVLKKYTITKSQYAWPEAPMIEAERALRLQIDEGNYGSLLAQSYGQEQWSGSRAAAEILGPLTKFTFFGRRGDASARPDNAALSQFHGQNYDRNPPRKFGYDPTPNGWIPSNYDRIFTYVRGFGAASSGSAAIKINFHGLMFDLRDQEIFYDPAEKRLVFLWPYGFSELSRDEYGVPERN